MNSIDLSEGDTNEIRVKIDLALTKTALLYHLTNIEYLILKENLEEQEQRELTKEEIIAFAEKKSKEKIRNHFHKPLKEPQRLVTRSAIYQHMHKAMQYEKLRYHLEGPNETGEKLSLFLEQYDYHPYFFNYDFCLNTVKNRSILTSESIESFMSDQKQETRVEKKLKFWQRLANTIEKEGQINTVKVYQKEKKQS